MLDHGGSTIGYQILWRFNKSGKSGYIILTNVNGLLYGKKNFDSVWMTVSSLDKLLKLEYSTSNFKVYIMIGIIGININILYFRRRFRIKREKAKN